MYRFNLIQDRSKYEGWKITCRANMDNKKENKIFIFLRRKYIPPFFDCYQDLVFIISEPIEEPEVEMTADLSFVIETLVDSIYPLETICGNKDYLNLLEAKVEAFLLDEETYKYYFNVLYITGKETYKLGFDYLYKVLTMLEDTMRDGKFADIRNSVEKKMLAKYKEWGETCNLLYEVNYVYIQLYSI